MNTCEARGTEICEVSRDIKIHLEEEAVIPCYWQGPCPCRPSCQQGGYLVRRPVCTRALDGTGLTYRNRCRADIAGASVLCEVSSEFDRDIRIYILYINISYYYCRVIVPAPWWSQSLSLFPGQSASTPLTSWPEQQPRISFLTTFSA